MACKTTGKSGSKLFTILPGFSMFLRNIYAAFCDFKSAKAAKRLAPDPGGGAYCAHTEVGNSLQVTRHSLDYFILTLRPAYTGRLLDFSMQLK